MAYDKKYDWKNYRDKKGFPYSGTKDPLYIKERRELFIENGNGWWVNPTKERKRRLIKWIYAIITCLDCSFFLQL